MEAEEKQVLGNRALGEDRPARRKRGSAVDGEAPDLRMSFSSRVFFRVLFAVLADEPLATSTHSALSEKQPIE